MRLHSDAIESLEATRRAREDSLRFWRVFHRSWSAVCATERQKKPELCARLDQSIARSEQIIADLERLLASS